ncbi:MAG: hypothetical protein Q8L23_06530 [Caulobacter sp.]|nr:hypothetical protein [Caulobacter sp.]
MRRLNWIVLSIATMLAASQVQAAPAVSILDQFEASNSAVVFREHPDLARLTTVGSSRGQTYTSLPEELTAALTRVQTMMADVDTGWSEVIEMRVLTTSEPDRVAVAALIAVDPRLAGRPVSYRVLDRLSAPRAKVGLDVLVKSPAAVQATARRYGAGR